MLELIAKTGVFLGQPLTLSLIIILGFWRNEKIFGRTLFLLTFTLMYNVYLKSLWQVPLPQPLEGWAFPSGHMHSAVVFWGWLAYEFKKVWFHSIAFFILCLTGYGLVYNGYHYPVDILGAFGFGSFSIVIYALLQKLIYFKEKTYRFGFLFTGLGLLVLLLLGKEYFKPHLWSAYGALIGFTLGWWFLYPVVSLNNKQMAWLLTFTGLCIGAMMFGLVLNFMSFFLIGLWLVASKTLFRKWWQARLQPAHSQPSVQRALEE